MNFFKFLFLKIFGKRISYTTQFQWTGYKNPRPGGQVIGDFKRALDFVLAAEGGYTVDPDDPGGETNFGISKKSYPNTDIKNLTVEQASAIYERDFWLACHCDELPTDFAICIFDTAVNQGVTVAIRLLQVALDVPVDGIIGPATIMAAHNASPRKVLVFLAERLAAYARLMADKQGMLKYAVNWSFRVVSLAQFLKSTT